MSLAPGTKLGPYEILGPLGSGGMGVVYRARDERIGRDVAVKFLHGEYASEKSRLARFELEVRAAGRLSHPNIVAIHDVGTHEESPYVVTELVEGETLRDRLERGPLAPRKVIEVAAQIARGLSAAHDGGIVHRDLKPENVILSKDGRAKILDFGLAKLTGPAEGVLPTNEKTIPIRTQVGLVVGTVGYMAPEQVTGGVVDHRGDIFCLGVIVLEMATGRRAFTGGSDVEVMTSILKDEPAGLEALPAGSPVALESILRHCLEKSPAERFQSAHDVAFALEDLLRRTETGVSGAGGAARMQPARRGRASLVAGSVVLAVGAGLLLGSLLSRRGGPPVFHQLTFQRGSVKSARFTRAGDSVVYGAAWDGRPVQVYSMRTERPESREVGPPKTEVLALSRNGELLVSTNRRFVQLWCDSGTLARRPLEGGEARDVLEDVTEADWAPDGKTIAVVRLLSGRSRLESPPGKLLYETAGFVSHPRFSPDGERIAFLDHPSPGDDAGSVTVMTLDGTRTTLSQGWISAGGLAWGPSGREVWFTATETGASRAVHAVTLGGRLRTVLSVPGTLTLLDVSASGRVLVALERLRLCIAAGHARGSRDDRDVSFLDWSHARDLSGDGKQLLFDETAEGGGASNSVFLRKLDGSSPVRLGDGAGRALSPDGRWVIANLPVVPKQLLLLPTGAGEPRELTRDTINHLRARFFPDGRRFLFAGSEAGRAPRLYVQELEAGRPRAISPEGIGPFDALSPDGKSVAALDPGGRLVIYPVQGGPPTDVPGRESGDVPVAFSSDSSTLYVRASSGIPARVFRLDLGTGRRETWVELTPADAAGVQAVTDVLLTKDGGTYAYSFLRILSDLFVVDGLR